MLELGLWTALLGGIIHIMHAATYLAHRTFNTLIRARMSIQTISGVFLPTHTIDATPTSTTVTNATPTPTATCSATTLLYCDTDIDDCTGNDLWKPAAGIQAFVASGPSFGFERFRQLLWPHVAKAQASMAQLDPRMRILVACSLVAVVTIAVLFVARKAIVAYTSREERSQSVDLTIPGLDMSCTACGWYALSPVPYTQQDLAAFISRSATNTDELTWLTAVAPSASSDPVPAVMGSPGGTINGPLSPSLTPLASLRKTLSSHHCCDMRHAGDINASSSALSDIGNAGDIEDSNDYIPAERTATPSVVDHIQLTCANTRTPDVLTLQEGRNDSATSSSSASVKVLLPIIDPAFIRLPSSSSHSVSGAPATGGRTTTVITDNLPSAPCSPITPTSPLLHPNRIAPYAVDPAFAPLPSSSVLFESGAPATGDHVMDYVHRVTTPTCGTRTVEGLSTTEQLPDTSDDEDEVFIYPGAQPEPAGAEVTAQALPMPSFACLKDLGKDRALDLRDEVADIILSDPKRSLDTNMWAGVNHGEILTTKVNTNPTAVETESLSVASGSQIVESSLSTEDSLDIESSGPIEEPMVHENSPVVEDAPIIESSSIVDGSLVVEDLPSTQDAPIPTVVDEPQPVKEAVVIETPVVAEEPVVDDVERSPIAGTSSVIESSPTVVPLPFVEPLPVMDLSPTVEDAPVNKDMQSGDNTAPIERLAAVEDAPFTEESLAVDETPIVEKPRPVVDGTPVTAQSLITKESQTVDEASTAVENELVVEGSLIPLHSRVVEETTLPAREDSSAVERLHAVEDSPVDNDLPVIKCASILKDRPLVESPLPMEDSLAQQSTPAIEEDSSVIEKTSGSSNVGPTDFPAPAESSPAVESSHGSSTSDMLSHVPDPRWTDSRFNFRSDIPMPAHGYFLIPAATASSVTPPPPFPSPSGAILPSHTQGLAFSHALPAKPCAGTPPGLPAKPCVTTAPALLSRLSPPRRLDRGSQRSRPRVQPMQHCKPVVPLEDSRPREPEPHHELEECSTYRSPHTGSSGSSGAPDDRPTPDPDNSSNIPQPDVPGEDRSIASSEWAGAEDGEPAPSRDKGKGKQRDDGEQQEPVDEVEAAILEAIANSDEEEDEGEDPEGDPEEHQEGGIIKPRRKTKKKQNKKRNRRKCRNKGLGRSEGPEASTSSAVLT